MKKSIILCLLFLSSCIEMKDEYLWPKVAALSDTVLNDSFYEAKIYFANDSLIRIAKKNNIENILDVKFEIGVDGDLIFIPVVTKPATISGDTAYVKFEINIDDLEPGQTIEYYWNYHMAVDYIPNNITRDTVFAEMVRVFVKGN